MTLKLSSAVSSCANPLRPSSSTAAKIPGSRLMPPILSSRASLVTHSGTVLIPSDGSFCYTAPSFNSSKFQFIQDRFEPRALRRGTHNADLDTYVRRKVSLPHGRELLPIQRAQRLDRILLPHRSPPHRRRFREIGHGGPIRKVSRENHARMPFAV